MARVVYHLILEYPVLARSGEILLLHAPWYDFLVKILVDGVQEGDEATMRKRGRTLIRRLGEWKDADLRDVMEIGVEEALRLICESGRCWHARGGCERWREAAWRD